MEQLQTTFYILGIMYMVLNIIILLGIGLGMFLIVKKVFDIHRQITEKLDLVQKAVKHPEDIAAEVGANVINAGIRRIKKIFSGEPK